mgnify:CR=1 FL=1
MTTYETINSNINEYLNKIKNDVDTIYSTYEATDTITEITENKKYDKFTTLYNYILNRTPNNKLYKIFSDLQTLQLNNIERGNKNLLDELKRKNNIKYTSLIEQGKINLLNKLIKKRKNEKSL